jgi:4-hydroxy-4-methyl-2-oxoglutarate aldolase
MRMMMLAICLGLVCFLPACGSQGEGEGEKSGRLTTPEGVRILENKSFDDSPAARREILELYKGLRLTDVLDAMDLVGLQDMGLMDKEIRSLWRDVEDFSHRIVGFAITVRHVPTDVRVGQDSFPNLEGFKKFKAEQYGRAPDLWLEVAKPGDVVVIDAGGIPECGFIGSNNSLGWAEKGVVGVVTNGGARDTDEIIKVKRIAVYCSRGYSSRGVRPGRLIAESYNFPISCGGVLVYPGDLVIGDGDGVLVVPRERAVKVGKIAREIHVGDEKSRARRYERLGIPLDETVRVD